MNLTEVLNLIRELLSPASKVDQINLSKISICTIVENCLNNFLNKHPLFSQNLSNDDPLWSFGLLSLKLLQQLNEAEFEISPNDCYLSINDEKMISQFSQLIVCFTIHYNLEDNIGIPIEKLSNYGVNLTMKRSEISLLIRNERIFETLSIFQNIKNNKRKHINLIPIYFYRKYLHEFICALIQTVFSPNRKIGGEIFKKWLFEDLFEECDGANLVSNLIMAQATKPDKDTLWFTSRVGQLLTKCLLKPNSIINVIRAVLTEINAVSSVTVASDWKKCDVVAKIIAQCPKEVSIEDYFKLVSPQLMSLYFNQDIKFSKHFLRVSGSIYSLFSQRYPDLTQKYITEKILEEFKTVIESENFIKLSQKKFKEAFCKLHLVFVESTEPNAYAFSQVPVEIFIFLFKSYVKIKPKIECNLIKQNLQEFLKLYIKFNSDQLTLLDRVLMSVTDLKIKFNFEFFTDEDENSDCIVIECPNSENELSIKIVESHAKSLVNLIENLDQLKSEYMLFLLKKLIVEDKIESIGGNKLLLEIENGLIKRSKDINEKILYFTQLSCLFESINVNLIVKNYKEIIEFCKILIENFIKHSEASLDNELIQLVLGVVSVFTTGTIELDYDVKQRLQVLIPGLKQLKEIYSSSEIEDMIDSLYISISTYCGIKTESKLLIEEVCEDNYSKVLRDVNDPLIPVKAHGFVELRKLIEKKDPNCLQNIEKIIDLTLRGVKSEDSYLYLAAINCMISLTTYEPKKLLEPLIENFISDKRLGIEDRLKIGEILTKTIRNFNELVPVYAPKLLNAFLIGVKLNDDEIFKSSCLSNLGEICKLLNYTIQGNIYEILNCLSCYLETDKSIQVKRAAILVLKMIVEGLRKENFMQVLGESIVKLYKLLVKIKNSTQDDVIRLNCQLTSDYINEMMKNSMFPKQNLQKEIKILRP